MLDGITVPIQKPLFMFSLLSFFGKKGYYAIPLQAVVNYDYKCVAISSFCTGSTRDSMALAMSNIKRYIFMKIFQMCFGSQKTRLIIERTHY